MKSEPQNHWAFLLAEVITARSININTDYLSEGGLVKPYQDVRSKKMRETGFASGATWAKFYPFFQSCCASVKHTHTRRLTLAALPDHFSATFWCSSSADGELLKACTCPVFMQRSRGFHVRGKTFCSFLKKNNEGFKDGPVTQKMGSTTCNKVIFAYLFFQKCISVFFNLVEGGGGWTKLSILQVKTVRSVWNPPKKSVPKGRKTRVTKKHLLLIISQ